MRNDWIVNYFRVFLYYYACVIYFSMDKGLHRRWNSPYYIILWACLEQAYYWKVSTRLEKLSIVVKSIYTDMAVKLTCYRAAFWLLRFEAFIAMQLKIPFFSTVTLRQSVFRCRRFQASYFIHLQWSIGHYARIYCLSNRRIKAHSHISCRAHAVPLPCRAAKGFRMCLSHLIYTMRPCLMHTCHAMLMPCSDHAVLLKATARPSFDGRAVTA